MNCTKSMLIPRRTCAMSLLLVASVGCGFQVGALPEPSGATEGSTASIGTSDTTAPSGGTSTVTTMAVDSTGQADRDATSGDGSSGSGGADVPPPEPGPCCEQADEPGCEEPTVEACVCATDPYCCEQRWDGLCVEEVSTLGCGDCPGTTPPPARPCCGPRDGPGCGDPMLEGCVCEMDAYCCEVQWDDACADQVDALGCGQCLDPGAFDTDCCVAHPDPGCSEPGVQDCVCASDAFCCDTAWDEVCVAKVTELGCGMCEPERNGSDASCCIDHATAGCDDPTVASCVCAMDPFCCQVAWDELCVTAAETACGGCDPDLGSTGTVGSDSGSTGGSTGGSTTTG